MHDFFRPLERMSGRIVDADERIDRLAHLVRSREGFVTQGRPPQDTEPHLDHVEPAGMGRRVMKMDPRVAGKPPIALRFMDVQMALSTC